MKVLKKVKKLCLSCMEEHDVEIVETVERSEFKGEQIEFNAIYEFCSNTQEYSETEEYIKINDLSLKDAYRKKQSLLTSEEIKIIRERYSVSQKDFSQILDWGAATITRYENHQVQDRAHDDILRKIDNDPKWFLELLERAKGRLSEKAYLEYRKRGREIYREKKNQYRIEAICADYVDLTDDNKTGGVELNLVKVVDLINYLALKVESLHKVKLMKLMWYSDALSYKRTGRSITGLAYSALPMGAVPVDYEQILLLDGISFDTVYYSEDPAYKFRPTEGYKVQELTQGDISVVDDIINKFGGLTTNMIVETMHEEDAYKKTDSYCIINYSLTKSLSID